MFGNLYFLSPYLLLALAGLPLLWFLIRKYPPKPRKVVFPALFLLRLLKPEEFITRRTPLWLLILRMSIAALLIFMFSRPFLGSDESLVADKTASSIAIVIDNGFASARNWNAIKSSAEDIINANQQAKKILILTTAQTPDDSVKTTLYKTQSDAGKAISLLKPLPWLTDRTAAIKEISDNDSFKGSSIFWISDGINTSADFRLDFSSLPVSRVTVFKPQTDDLPLLIRDVAGDQNSLKVSVRRADSGERRQFFLRSEDEEGKAVQTNIFDIAPGAFTSVFELDLPREIRNRIAMFKLSGENHAAATWVTGGRERLHSTGIVKSSASDPQPYLSEIFYLRRALEPFSEIHAGSVTELLEKSLSLIIVPDSANLSDENWRALTNWASEGGVLMRFAGPGIAASATGPLPVILRQGERNLTGSLSWGESPQISYFSKESPLSGIAPPAQISIKKTIVAEPGAELDKSTWAALSDGSPFITGVRMGSGYNVLIHTSSNLEWSDFPLTGAFVETLARLASLGDGISARPGENDELFPVALLNAFGDLSSGADATGFAALTLSKLQSSQISPRTPPGIYASGGKSVPFNAGSAVKIFERIHVNPAPNISEQFYPEKAATYDITSYILPLLILLLALDSSIAALRPLRKFLKSSAAAVIMVILLHPAAHAGSLAEESAINPRLAYVKSGIPEADRLMQQAMQGLTREVSRRTTFDGGDPVGVDLAADPISLFPVIYWKINNDPGDMSVTAARALRSYMNGGGLLMIDLSGIGAEETRNLSRVIKFLGLRPLIKVTGDHVLTRSFYLLNDFPGRFPGSGIYVEDMPEGVNDGVSSVIIGDADWASAWAISDSGTPLYPISHGGENAREMSYRAGVNMIMYALCGSYKADQIHVPAILERLK